MTSLSLTSALQLSDKHALEHEVSRLNPVGALVRLAKLTKEVSQTLTKNQAEMVACVTLKLSKLEGEIMFSAEVLKHTSLVAGDSDEVRQLSDWLSSLREKYEKEDAAFEQRMESVGQLGRDLMQRAMLNRRDALLQMGRLEAASEANSVEHSSRDDQDQSRMVDCVLGGLSGNEQRIGRAAQRLVTSGRSLLEMRSALACLGVSRLLAGRFEEAASAFQEVAERDSISGVSSGGVPSSSSLEGSTFGQYLGSSSDVALYLVLTALASEGHKKLSELLDTPSIFELLSCSPTALLIAEMGRACKYGELHRLIFSDLSLAIRSDIVLGRKFAELMTSIKNKLLEDLISCFSEIPFSFIEQELRCSRSECISQLSALILRSKGATQNSKSTRGGMRSSLEKVRTKRLDMERELVVDVELGPEQFERYAVAHCMDSNEKFLASTCSALLKVDLLKKGIVLGEEGGEPREAIA